MDAHSLHYRYVAPGPFLSQRQLLDSLFQAEICQVVNVKSVKIEAHDETSLANARLSVPQEDLYELPTCPVCLERMDSSATGLVTIPCMHTFHCTCLTKWGDSRYVLVLFLFLFYYDDSFLDVQCVDTRKAC